MIGNEVHDYRQLKAVKKQIAADLNKKRLFKSLLHCGSKVPRMYGHRGVAVVANKKQAKFVGVSSCKSSWGCPVCTARQMSKYAQKISCALDALKAQGLRAAMFTFTIPHTSGFSCEQSTEILYNVWKAFTVHGNKILQASKNDVFSNFCASFNSKHRVRVAEYTWGLKGWHPHFHCLLWFPANRLNEILEWEERLNKRWLELCERYTIRQLLIGYPETQRKTVRAQVETRVKIMYQKMDVESSKGVYISKANNSVIVQESSNYLCGWGANREVTGNFQAKASNPNHYTWQQILENAIDSDSRAQRKNIYFNENLSKQHTDDNSTKTAESCENEINELKPAEGSCKKEVSKGAAPAVDWWQLYFEYMTATRKQRHARINFSVHSGLMQIIKDWQQTQSYKTFLKKNATDQQKTFGVWRTVCWFSVAQWQEICKNDLEARILELATENNAKQLIDKLLEIYQILPSSENQAEAAKLERILNAA